MNTESFLLPASTPHLEVAEFSHQGLVRENNEDNILVQSFQRRQPGGPSVLLAVLADGVGGHKAGEVASRIAVDSIAETVRTCENLDHPEELLVKAFETANQKIVEQSQTDDAQKGMGTTAVCALIIGERLYLANMGDSRLYFLRNRAIQQLTFDHTWLEELIQAGYSGGQTLSRAHPLAHVLNRYLGSNEPIQVDLRMRKSDAPAEQSSRYQQGLPLEAGDILLLSSDGISDLLEDEEIRVNLLKRQWTQSARRLVYCALKKGGHDNASAIAIRVPANVKKKII